MLTVSWYVTRNLPDYAFQIPLTGKLKRKSKRISQFAILEYLGRWGAEKGGGGGRILHFPARIGRADYLPIIRNVGTKLLSQKTVYFIFRLTHTYNNKKSWIKFVLFPWFLAITHHLSFRLCLLPATHDSLWARQFFLFFQWLKSKK